MLNPGKEMSLFRRNQSTYDNSDTEAKDNNSVSDTVQTEIEEKRYEGDLFDETMKIVTSPDNKYLTNIQNGNIEKEEFLEIIKRQLEKFTSDEDQIKDSLERLDKWIWGYYIIEDFLNDDRISDVKIYNENNIRLKRKGKRIGTNEKFKNKSDYLRFVDNICAKNKVSLTDLNSILVFSDIEGNDRARLRFNITGPNINVSEYPVVQIRKILKHKKSLEALTTAEENHMIPKELLPFLKHVAKHSSGMLVTGKGASGKTTFMNAMLDEIPFDKSVDVIQETDELFSDVHPDMMIQHIVTSQGEGKINYDLKKIATNGLRVDLDYYIIGEITGDEAESFMNAAYTGHRCWTSSHGKSAIEGINKLIDYIVRATRYSRKDVIKMLTALEILVFMKDYKIQEIVKIEGINKDGEFVFRNVYDAKHPEKSTVLNWKESEEDDE